MTDKTIEARIREHYVSDNGEWLVEKGKLKEAKLLKEACETIERLRRQVVTADKSYYALLASTTAKEKELKEGEDKLAYAEMRMRSALEETQKTVQYLLGQNK